MQDFLNSFNNKDYAALLFCIFIMFILSRNNKSKNTIAEIKRIILSWPIILIISLMAFYILLCILFLSKINIWNISLVKDTTLWFVFCAFPQIINVCSGKTNTAKELVLRTLSTAAILTLVIEFFINLYPFSLAGELIIILGAYMFYGWLVRSKINDRQSFQRTESIVLAIFIVFIFSRTIYMLSVANKVAFTANTFITMFWPLILSVLFLPFIITFLGYFHLTESYRKMFFVASRSISNKFVRIFSNFYAIVRLNFSLHAVEAWMFLLPNTNMVSICEAFHAINSVVADIKLQKIMDCSGEGWSVNDARNFLDRSCFNISAYKTDSTDWFASAMHFINDQQIQKDTIFYCINGTSKCVTSLSLTLSVYSEGDEEQTAIAIFLSCIKELFAKALPDNSLDVGIENAILKRIDYQSSLDGTHISVLYEKFNTLYTIKVSIGKSLN